MQPSTFKCWRISRRISSLLALLGLLSWPALLRAADSALQWNPAHARFRTSESVVTGALALQAASVVLLYPQPAANWRGGILFDDAIRDAVLLEGTGARASAARWSDNLYYGLLAYPLLVDTAIVTWGAHGSTDVANEMLAMNLEAYAFSGAIALTAEKIGRVRPAERGCREDATYSPKCGNDVALNASFASGHTALAFTSAGLTCAHHQHLPLYGGGAPDLAACLVALSAASATGVLRVMSDNHYTSDVLIGMGIGLFGGYGLPTLLHYGPGSAAGDSFESVLPIIRMGKGAQAIAGVLAPRVGPNEAGLMLVGAF